MYDISVVSLEDTGIIMAKFPEIISEFINKAESDELRHFKQYYFAKNQDSIFFYEQGGSGSSGQRYDHGFYGHLFALLNSEKPIPTYFFTYDGRNRLIFEREEKSLWLNFFDLVGNFKMDWKDSEQILKDVVKIKDKFQSIIT